MFFFFDDFFLCCELSSEFVFPNRDISDLVEKDKSDRPSFSALTKGVAPSSVSSVLRGGPTFPAPLNSSFGFASSGSDRAEEAGPVAKKRPPMRLGIRSGMRAQPAAGPHIPTEEELLAMLIPSSNKAPVSYPPAIQPLSSANPLQFPSGIVRPSFLDQSSTDSLLPSSTENAMSVSHESQNLPVEGISASQTLVSIVAEVDEVTDEDMQTEASVSMVITDHQSVGTTTAPVAIVEERMESSEIAATDSAPSPFVEEVAVPMLYEEEQSSPMTQQLRVLREVDTLLQVCTHLFPFRLADHALRELASHRRKRFSLALSPISLPRYCGPLS